MTTEPQPPTNDQFGTDDSFTLHPRLAADTLVVGDLPLCRVLLMKNAAFPWLILVPRCNATEIHRLPPADRAALMEETTAASALLERLTVPDKINVGALGNMVPQLHMHVVARRRTDGAWPGPVWGSGVQQDYAPGEAEVFARLVAAGLGL